MSLLNDCFRPKADIAMTARSRLTLAMLVLAAVPIVAVAALFLYPAPDVHWIGSANAFTRGASSTA